MPIPSMIEVKMEMEEDLSRNLLLGKWKLEPISPNSNSLSTGDVDDLTYSDDIDEDDEDNGSILINNAVDPKLNDKNNSSRAQVATKLLEQLDEWMKQEEPLTDWLEEKVESLFDEIPLTENSQNKQIVYPFINNNVNKLQLQPESTQYLLQEFESVLGDVEACHQIFPSGSSTLTPPQSPPPPPPTLLPTPNLSPPINNHSNINSSLPIDTQLMVTFQPYQQSIDFNGLNYSSVPVSLSVSIPTAISTSPISPTTTIIDTINNDDATNIKQPESYFGQISGEWNAENISLIPLVGDVNNELKEVDEYVRSCAEDITPSTSGPASPSSVASSFETSDDSIDDPEWTLPSTSNKKTTFKTTKQIAKIQKNRYKPYGRSTEDKKNRKKEQNKNAATRYRQKKKQQVTEILGEEQELINHNDKLKNQVTELKREIGYLKGLMRDLFKAKGLIN